MCFELALEKNYSGQSLAHLLDKLFPDVNFWSIIESKQLHRTLRAFHRVATQGAHLRFGFI